MFRKGSFSGIVLTIIIIFNLNSFFTACSSQNRQQKQQRVENKAYDLMLQTILSHTVNGVGVDSLREIRDKAVLLDTRTRAEYEVSRIQGARFVGYESFDTTAVEDLPRDTAIIAYCAVGYRSERVAERLKQMGFTNVGNLYGGIFEWKNRDLTVVTDSGATERIHAYNKTWGFWLNKGEKVYEN